MENEVITLKSAEEVCRYLVKLLNDEVVPVLRSIKSEVEDIAYILDERF